MGGGGRHGPTHGIPSDRGFSETFGPGPNNPAGGPCDTGLYGTGPESNAPAPYDRAGFDTGPQAAHVGRRVEDLPAPPPPAPPCAPPERSRASESSRSRSGTDSEQRRRPMSSPVARRCNGGQCAQTNGPQSRPGRGPTGRRAAQRPLGPGGVAARPGIPLRPAGRGGDDSDEAHREGPTEGTRALSESLRAPPPAYSLPRETAAISRVPSRTRGRDSRPGSRTGP